MHSRRFQSLILKAGPSAYGLMAALCLAVAVPVSAQTPPPTQDVLTLNSGVTVVCRVLETTPEKLTIEYRSAGTVVATRRDVAWADLKTVEFAMDDEFRALVASNNPAKDGAKIQARWEALAPLLSRPNHPAGDIGLTYARLTGQLADTASKEAALKVCSRIEAEDWNPTRKAQATFLKAGILSNAGRKEEALTALQALTTGEVPDARVASQAHLMLAALLGEKLAGLEKEHPRWEEDDKVRPQREKLYHDLIDHCLKPALFYGSVEGLPASGLWLAVEIQSKYGSKQEAGSFAQDLLNLYPSAPEAAQAKDFLTKHNLPLLPVTATAPPTKPAATAPKEAPAPGEPENPQVTKRARHAKPDDKAMPPQPAMR